MEFLSWLFFCLSPFALFCTESGGGLILCPIFIILGFLCRHADCEGASQTTVKIEPQELWEWHYKDRMRSTLAQKDSIGDYLMSTKDQEARRWATTVCGYNNAYVPPKGKQEQIARACGVVTEEMIKERNEKYDRTQIGKFFLMKELMEKYHSKKVGKGGRERCYFPQMKIKEDICKIRTLDNCLIDDYMIQNKHNKTIKEMWDNLSEEEKKQIERWGKEYEEKLMKMVYEYVEGKRHNVQVEMDF